MADKKIRILFVSISLKRHGGVETYVGNLIKNLPQDRFRAEHFKVGKSDTKWHNLFLPAIFVGQVFRFYLLIRGGSLDIVHINASMDWIGLLRNWPLMLITKTYGIPTVFCVGGWKSYVTTHFKGAFSPVFRKLLMLPDRIMVLADSFRGELLELGIPRNRVSLYTMMVDIVDFSQAKSKKDARAPRVLFCSRIEKAKGVYELIDAIPVVLKTAPQARFIFMGDGRELLRLKSLAERKGLTDNIEFLGHLSGEDKIRVYLDADIFVLPSYTEGFPNVICEALAAGLPIVATRVGAIEEVIENGENGLLLRQLPPSAEEIAQNISRLIADSELRQAIAKNNFLASRRYDSRVVAQEVGNSICQILSESS